jgi:hypothetical protein
VGAPARSALELVAACEVQPRRVALVRELVGSQEYLVARGAQYGVRKGLQDCRERREVLEDEGAVGVAA